MKNFWENNKLFFAIILGAVIIGGHFVLGFGELEYIIIAN